MSGHADIVRERVSHIARGCRAGTSHNPAVYENDINAALDALVAALATSERSRAEYIEETIRLRESLFAAEAEVARLRREIHDTATWLSLWTEQGEDHPRAVSLRAALGEDA